MYQKWEMERSISGCATFSLKAVMVVLCSFVTSKICTVYSMISIVQENVKMNGLKGPVALVRFLSATYTLVESANKLLMIK